MDGRQPRADRLARDGRADDADDRGMRLRPDAPDVEVGDPRVARILDQRADFCRDMRVGAVERSEEHTSELQSLMRISYAVFCLKKKKHDKKLHRYTIQLQKSKNTYVQTTTLTTQQSQHTENTVYMHTNTQT